MDRCQQPYFFRFPLRGSLYEKAVTNEIFASPTANAVPPPQRGGHECVSFNSGDWPYIHRSWDKKRGETLKVGTVIRPNKKRAGKPTQQN